MSTINSVLMTHKSPKDLLSVLSPSIPTTILTGGVFRRILSSSFESELTSSKVRGERIGFFPFPIQIIEFCDQSSMDVNAFVSTSLHRSKWRKEKRIVNGVTQISFQHTAFSLHLLFFLHSFRLPVDPAFLQ